MPSLLDLGASTQASAHPALAPTGNGLEPGISLKLAPPQGGNPLAQIEGWADIRNKQNQSKLFDQTFRAKQKAGQILAHSEDLETGLQGLYNDPDVAPFAGEIVSSIRQGMLAQTQLQGEQQTQAISGFDATRKGLAAIAVDPTEASWKAATDPVLATLSPTARKSVASAMTSLKNSLFSDLPEDPAKAKGLVQARVAGLLAGNPDVMGLLFGKPETKDGGGVLIPGMTSQTSGVFTPAGRIGKTLAPTVVKGVGPGGEDVTTVWGGGNGLGGGGTATPGPVVPRPSHAPNTAPQPAAPNALSPARGALIGPDLTTREYSNKRTDDVIDYEKNLDDRVNNGSNLRKNMGETIQAAKKAAMGGGAETYAKLGSMLQAMGVKTETADKWANGSLSSSQVIDKVALNNSMQQLKQQLTGVGGSRLNAQEFVAYMNKNPNLTTDPRAVAEMFQLWNEFYDRDMAEQKAFDQFKRGKPTGDAVIDEALGDGKPDIKRWPGLWNQSNYMRGFAPGGKLDTTGMKGLNVEHPADIQEILKRYPKPGK